ncbi:MAG: sigma 54-interacting transcriptional regulator [Massilia sp.]
MGLFASAHFLDASSAAERAGVALALAGAGIDCAGRQPCAALAMMAGVDPQVLGQLRALSAQTRVLAVVLGEQALAAADMWALLGAGAADVLRWRGPPADLADVAARLARWETVRTLVDSAPVQASAAGNSPIWRELLHCVAEMAAFSDAPVLITGETGTGKDVIAQLIHKLGRTGGSFTVLDCTTLSPELAGSELFGHERGAFTGAAAARDGAFALADGGVLFLDEVGELPLPLQAQLLRAIQEHSYKRIGSNSWQRSSFRLLCATNRDLEQEVAQGRFRADLYYRIAAWRCRPPPLRERREDVLPLAMHFLAQLAPGRPAPALDPAVRDYLLTRDYPGNVRELRQVVTQLWHRHTGCGALTIGSVPPEERPAPQACERAWPDRSLEAAVRHAIDLGVPLARISQCAGDLAIQMVLAQEGDNNQRAAARLGVTDRALQIRRKAWSALTK